MNQKQKELGLHGVLRYLLIVSGGACRPPAPPLLSGTARASHASALIGEGGAAKRKKLKKGKSEEDESQRDFSPWFLLIFRWFLCGRKLSSVCPNVAGARGQK